ncbi:MAG: lactate utilization protein, partial [Candidatus Tectomicrobia bacterium]|nr:lactate utilization protein [Candidatus Tectomicrobia bacterium]
MRWNAREEILRTIQYGLGRIGRGDGAESSARPSVAKEEEYSERIVQRREELKTKRETLVRRLAEEIGKVRGAFYRATSKEMVAEQIRIIAQNRDMKSIVQWDSPLLDGQKIGETLRKVGIDVISPSQLFATSEEQRRKSLRELTIQANMGVTGVDYVMAETATLVLIAKEGQERLTSLLPPVHVAVVNADRVIYGLEDLFLFVKGEELPLSSCLTFITGPSRTADIELSLTVGV